MNGHLWSMPATWNATKLMMQTQTMDPPQATANASQDSIGIDSQEHAHWAVMGFSMCGKSMTRRNANANQMLFSPSENLSVLWIATETIFPLEDKLTQQVGASARQMLNGMMKPTCASVLKTIKGREWHANLLLHQLQQASWSELLEVVERQP